MTQPVLSIFPDEFPFAMTTLRFRSSILLLLVVALGLAGCEPYMSVTDRIPAQTRQATALLPPSPRYVGMVDLETVFAELEAFTDVDVVDSLRATEPKPVRTFLDATGMNPKTDLKAVYGALGKDESFSAVVFADLTPSQIDRYLDQASGTAGRSTTYRGVPVYHLTTGRSESDEDSPDRRRDTLSMAFVRNGMIATATDAGRVEAMIDRFREQTKSFRENRHYMTLVKRVGRGSTAWLVGRDVLQSALRDSAGRKKGASPHHSRVGEAGLQRLLSKWSDRVLGLSDASSSFRSRTGPEVERLGSRIREQAVSLTLTGEALEGEVYLKMRDKTTASDVADIARGAVAALKLSKDELEDRHRDLLDELDIEQKGPVLRVRFAVDREHVRRATQTARRRHSAHRSEASIRRATLAIRRTMGISGPTLPLKALRGLLEAATSVPEGLSTAMQ